LLRCWNQLHHQQKATTHAANRRYSEGEDNSVNELQANKLAERKDEENRCLGSEREAEERFSS